MFKTSIRSNCIIKNHELSKGIGCSCENPYLRFLELLSSHFYCQIKTHSRSFNLLQANQFLKFQKIKYGIPLNLYHIKKII